MSDKINRLIQQAHIDKERAYRLREEIQVMDEQITALTRELAEARDTALEEAAAFIDAHAALEKAGICDLSGASDPPLTKEAAQSVSERNDRRTAQAAAYEVIAAAIRGLKEKP